MKHKKHWYKQHQCFSYCNYCLANSNKAAGHASIIINDLDSQFEKATKLNGIDITFLFFATTLQCVRQYIIGTITQRTDDKTAVDKTNELEEEHSDRSHN